MAENCVDIEEHELPSVEAVIACTLVLMTGYSQALQAEVHPQQRLAMGENIAHNLRMLVEHPQLSLGFRQVLLGLRTRWQAMGACTRESAHDGDGCSPRCPEPFAARRPGSKQLH